jgi:ribosome-associated protein
VGILIRLGSHCAQPSRPIDRYVGCACGIAQLRLGIGECSKGRVAWEDGQMEEIKITGDTIRLGQLLKLANLVEQGAGAKVVLAADLVTVNGVLETRRGRQLVPGDVVSLAGTSVRVC